MDSSLNALQTQTSS